MPYRFLLFFLTFLLIVFTKNFIISLFGLLSFIFIIEYFRKVPGPKILLFSFLYQWFQINVKLIYANVIGINHQELFLFPTNINTVSIYSNLGLIFLCTGIFIIIKRNYKNWLLIIKTYSFKSINIGNLIILYISFSAIASALLNFGWSVTGLAQFMTKFVTIQWGFMVVLIFIAISNPVYKNITFFVILFQILLSFSSYFSSFKIFIFYFLIGALLHIKKLTLKTTLLALIITIVVIIGGLMWTGIKAEYRTYLTKGEKVQSTTVTKGEALNKLADLSSVAIRGNLFDNFIPLLDRISYIDFFSSAMEYVPSQRPHENGTLTGRSFMHIFMPRILFPNKPALDDSKDLNTYCGLNASGSDEATSIGMGYFTYLYIDFGFPLMLLPLFLIGIYIGYVYVFCFTRVPNYFWSIVYVSPLFLSLMLFETSLPKFFGSITMWFLIVGFFGNIIAKFINPLLFKPKTINK